MSASLTFRSSLRTDHGRSPSKTSPHTGTKVQPALAEARGGAG
jgi:hypothetical protein